MTKRVAVLGAGIMGSCLAIFLARRGFTVVLLDEAAAPMGAASRWNEGKIHLGYIYARDESLETARRIIPGGLAFKPLIENLLEESIEGRVTDHDDTFLIHRDSVVGVEAAARYYEAVGALTREHPDARAYLTDVSAARPRRLTGAELAAITDRPDILAGFAVPERSVATNQVADRLTALVTGHPRIALRCGNRITGAAPAEGGRDGWTVRLAGAPDERFDLVVNALGHGRPAVDAAAGMPPEPGWSHRFRLSLFVRTVRPVTTPSAIVAVGPFGDVKSYGGRDYYLSWYPAGLKVDSEALEPPAPPALDAAGRDAVVAAVRNGLGALIPAVREVVDAAEAISVGGGFVFAIGRGSLADPAASLHRRDRFGIRRMGSWVSVDTGKYSVAPWLALQLAREIAGETG